MKKMFILVLSMLVILAFVENTHAIDEIDSVATLISENIDLFNLPVEDGKEETYFTQTQYIVPIFDESKSEIGTLITFDDNDGYFMYSKDNVILEYNYHEGFPLDLSKYPEGIVKDMNGYYSLRGKLIYSIELPLYGAGVNFQDKIFYRHNNADFNKKTRHLLYELDKKYQTPVNISLAQWGNWDTHSTDQEGNSCGPIALANLLWTYKTMGIVDLTKGSTNSKVLAERLKPYLSYNETFGTNPLNIVPGMNDFLRNTGYAIDSIDVTNGIQDNLNNGPIVGLYSSATIWETAHLVLVTGKGRSLYKTILWVDFYTSWDITNTWHDKSADGKPPTYKYWVDNQYIWGGWKLVQV